MKGFKKTEIGLIPEDWEMKELGEEMELLYGKGLTENNRKSGNIPVFGSNGIVGFHNEALVKGPGVIIGRKGSVGEVKFSKSDFWPIDTTYYVKLRSSGDIAFWYYFLLNKKLIKLNSHSAVPGLNRDQVYQIVSNIPPLPEQRAIAKILSDLDARIELNQQMNKTLEAIGQALFKHWFVDFEFPCLPKSYDFGAGKPADFDSICTYKAVGGLPVPDGKKWFVYVLLCKNESFYIGITNDLYRRWYEHKKGIGAKWTKANEPIKVIHYEEYNSQAEAAKREKELKTGFGRKWLKREYNKYLKLKQGLPACNAQAGLPAPECKLRQAGRMVYNEELGKEIPEGWRVGRLGEFISFEKGRKPTHVFDFYQDGLLPQILIEVLDGGSCGFANIENMIISNENDIIMVMDGASSGRCARGFGGILGSTLAKIVIKDLSQNYVYYFLKERENDIKENTTGTSIPHADKGRIEKYQIIIPSQDILNKFNHIIDNLFLRQILARKQSLTLSRIRDALLPKLMSGKIRVPVDEMVNGENL